MQTNNTTYLQKLKHINTIIFDVDGVLTNGVLIATDNGELWRLFNAKDGYALKIALQKKTGARGLRSILEQVMLDVMFELPSNDKINKCIVTKNAVLGLEKPQVIEGERKKLTSEDGPDFNGGTKTVMNNAS